MDEKKILLPQYEVEGLDTNKLLSKVVDRDESGNETYQLIMRANQAFAWFYTVFPQGSLTHNFITLNDKKAIVTATVYRNEGETRPAASATCTRYYNDTTDGLYFEQNAVTAAYKKALSYLGFNIPLDAKEVDGIETIAQSAVPELGEKGIPLPAPFAPVFPTTPIAPSVPNEEAITEEETPKAPEKRTRRTQKEMAEFRKAKEESEMNALAAAEALAKGETELQTTGDKIVPEALNLDAENDFDNDYDILIEPSSMPPEAEFEPYEEQAEIEKAINEIFTPVIPITPPPITPASAPTPITSSTGKPTTYEEALEVIVPIGRSVGKTIERAAELFGDNTIRYLLDKCRTQLDGTDFIIAAEIFCKHKNI